MNNEQPTQLPMPALPYMAPPGFRPPNRFTQAAQIHTLLERCRHALRKRWWILFLALLFITGPAMVYAWLKPPTFQSQAIMWMTGRLNLPEGRLLSEELSNYMATQGDLIKSGVIQLRAYDRVRARFPELAAMETNAAPGTLPFTLAVRTSMKSSVLELTAAGPSPDATRAFLDTVMEEYLNFKKDARKQTSFGALSTITDQVREAEKRIQSVQDQITAFETTNTVSYLTEHGQSAGRRLAELSSILSDLRTESRLLELLTPDQVRDLGERAGNVLSGSRVRVPGDRTTQELFLQSSVASMPGYYQAMQQLQLLKARRDDLSQYLRPTHSKMMKLNQEIAGLEKLTSLLTQDNQQQVQAQLTRRKQSIDLQIQNLEAQYRSWETNAGEANRKLADYDRLKQNMQRAQALYDKMMGLVQTVDLNKSLDQEPLAPMAPASASRPTLSKYKIAAAGLFLAFLFAAGLVLVIEVMDDRFTSVDELNVNLTENVIGQIPESTLTWRNGKPQHLKGLEEQHAFAESFRNLRSSLLFMFEAAFRPKVILMTSAVPEEGKTTVAAHFAASLASAGSRVLLIDADLHRSSLHQLFQVSQVPGLREILSEGLVPAEAIVPVQIPQANGHLGDHSKHADGERSPGSGDSRLSAVRSTLFLLPAGRTAATYSELFLGQRLDSLFQDLSKQFDYIVIDSAPVLATDDVASLGPKVDGVLVVVRASYTSSRMAKEALDRLRKRRIKVLGVIYNRARTASDYYYRYSAHYRESSRARSEATSI